ncbi:unnamed protein product [Camellia sinensis]
MIPVCVTCEETHQRREREREREREKMGAASFRWILQLHKDVPKAAKLYSEGLDFSINVCTLRWAELQSGSLKLALLHSPSEHAMQKGYSSLLSFTVTDINSTVTKLMALGAELDGPIKHEFHGKRLQQSGVSTDTWWASMSPPEGSNFAFRESDERIVVFMKKLENNKK